MKTSVIGFPRVGANRELKFATEKYFRNELTEEQLLGTAAELRRLAWERQQKNGISFIPSNDFSFYDGMLDTLFLFDLVPEEYRSLGLSPLDTYFAAARGYQGESGDVKALAMKKWFNTNYHYIVPEIDEGAQFRLVGTKPFDEYREAKALGIETTPTVIGPYTFLRLAKFRGGRTRCDLFESAVLAYSELLSRFEGLGCKWLRLDEPALVYDLSDEDVRFFKSLYIALLSHKGGVKVLLGTYFGDVRDSYCEIVGLDFDGIGLDFIEGRQTAALIEKYGFPRDKVLFAGVVNGKNIWRNHYDKSLSIIEGLKKQGIEAVISTSCSLLHVPFTLESETKLPDDVRAHFAFAYEKLEELRDLGSLADGEHSAALDANRRLFDGERYEKNTAVLKRAEAVSDSDYTRLPAFEERERIQKAEFGLPVFPTTTIGSFPQTADVKANRSAFKKHEIGEQTYKEFNRRKIAECIAFQEEIGLDVLVHGEFERNDMVEYFGENLDGFLFTEKAWVQSYGTRCVKPPIIWGDVSRRKPITVEWSVYAQSLTKKCVKGMLTGPVTILNWSFPREDISLRESTLQIALAVRDEVLDLEKNGIRIIQIDEAALREKLPLRKTDWYSEYLDWAIPAFRLVHSGVKPETQIHTHMCYSEFTDIIPAIDSMDADVITFEASRSDLQILDSLRENDFRTEVGPGVYDIHSPRVPSVQEITDVLRKILTRVDSGKLWVNPDCGLKTRGTEETEKSLKNLVEAARTIRREYEVK